MPVHDLRYVAPRDCLVLAYSSALVMCLAQGSQTRFSRPERSSSAVKSGLRHQAQYGYMWSRTRPAR